MEIEYSKRNLRKKGWKGKKKLYIGIKKDGVFSGFICSVHHKYLQDKINDLPDGYKTDGYVFKARIWLRDKDVK